MARRQHLTLTFVLVLVAFCTLSYLFSGPSVSAVPGFAKAPAGEPLKANEKSEFVVDLNAIPTGFLEGESIAPRLENATLK